MHARVHASKAHRHFIFLEVPQLYHSLALRPSLCFQALRFLLNRYAKNRRLEFSIGTGVRQLIADVFNQILDFRWLDQVAIHLLPYCFKRAFKCGVPGEDEGNCIRLSAAHRAHHRKAVCRMTNIQSEIRTSNCFMAMRFNASGTVAAAVTLNPKPLNIAGRVVRMPGSSSTNNIVAAFSIFALDVSQRRTVIP